MLTKRDQARFNKEILQMRFTSLKVGGIYNATCCRGEGDGRWGRNLKLRFRGKEKEENFIKKRL